MLSRRVTLMTLFLTAMVITQIHHPTPSNADGGERRVALVIGLNDYMEQVSPLRCAVNDARTLKQTLIDCAGFSPEDIIVMTTADRSSGLPTNVNIRQCLQSLRTKLRPRDTLFFFFSGHGVELDDESYLLTFEANPYSVEALKASCLPVSALTAELSQMQAGHTLLFLDACRQDPRVKPSPGPELYDPAHPDTTASHEQRANTRSRSFAKELLVVGPGSGETQASTMTTSPSAPIRGHAVSFFSCDLGQRSFEWPEKNMGFFTYYLVNGLRSAASDSQGQVTVASLDTFLSASVPSAVETRFKMRQTPTMTQANAAMAAHWSLRSTPPAVAATQPLPDTTAPTDIRRRSNASRLTYALDIVSNNVEARDYNVLTHRIEEHFYEVDNDAIRKEVVALLDSTGTLTQAHAGGEADVWIFFNVCPTRSMMVDLLVRDRESQRVVLRQNEQPNRPYPGTGKQLVAVPVNVLKTKMLVNLATALKRAYAP